MDKAKNTASAASEAARKAAIAERRKKAKEERERKEKSKTNVRTALAGRKDRDRIILSAFEALFVQNVSVEELEHHASVLNKDDYFDVVRERTLSLLCGYPLCGGPLQGDASNGKGQFRISLSQRKIYSNKGRKYYCCDQCHTASSMFASSMPDYRKMVDPADYFGKLESLAAEDIEEDKAAEGAEQSPGGVGSHDGRIVEKELKPPSKEFDAGGFRSVEGFKDTKAGEGKAVSKEEDEDSKGGRDALDVVAEGVKGLAIDEEKQRQGDVAGSGHDPSNAEGGKGGARKKKKGKKKGSNPWSAMVFGGGGGEDCSDEDDEDDEIGVVELPPSTRLLLLIQRYASSMSKFRLKLQPSALAFQPPTRPHGFVVDWEHTSEPMPSRLPAELEPLRGTQGVHSAGGGRERNASMGRRKILSAAIAKRFKVARGLASEGHKDWGEMLGGIGHVEGAMWTLIQSLDVDTDVPNLTPQQSDALLLLFLSLLRGTHEHVARSVVGEDGACKGAFQRLWLETTGLTADHFVSMQFPFLPDKDVDDWLVMEGEVTPGMAMWKECGGDLTTFAELEELD